jgi:biopolymer transport protein ExbB
VFFNGLNNRVRIVMHQLDTLKTALVNRLTSDVADLQTQTTSEPETDAPRPIVSLARQGA